MEEKNEEVWYSYYLCKGRRYLLGEIRKIDNEYLLKMETYDLGVIIYTPNYSYKFEQTNSRGYIFKERANLDDKTKSDLKELKPETEREGYNYYYSERDLKLILGDYPTLPERIERIKYTLNKLRSKYNKKENYEDNTLD